MDLPASKIHTYLACTLVVFSFCSQEKKKHIAIDLNFNFFFPHKIRRSLGQIPKKQKYKMRNHKQLFFTFYLFPQIQAKQKRGRDKDRSSPASHLSDCCGGGKLKRKRETKYLQTRSKGALRAQILAGEEKLHILVVGRYGSILTALA